MRLGCWESLAPDQESLRGLRARKSGILDFRQRKVAALSERDGRVQDRWSRPVTAQMSLKTIHAGKRPVPSH